MLMLVGVEVITAVDLVLVLLTDVSFLMQLFAALVMHLGILLVML